MYAKILNKSQFSQKIKKEKKKNLTMFENQN